MTAQVEDRVARRKASPALAPPRFAPCQRPDLRDTDTRAARGSARFLGGFMATRAKTPAKEGAAKRGAAAAALVLAAATLAGCESSGVTGFSQTISRGYVFDEAALAAVRPGADVQAVLQTLGTPSTVSTVGNQTFYYISQTATRTFAFQNPTVTDQRVVAIYFNRQFKVERVANYGIQDGRVFDFISRTTPAAGQEASFVANLFRGLLRF
jgi:outer membrane protein assembly factor BamE (lipoprotein component of BamABCDE complex)